MGRGCLGRVENMSRQSANRVRRILSRILALLAGLLPLLLDVTVPRAVRSGEVAQPVVKEEEAVVATVNGRPIYESRLLHSIPKGLFSSQKKRVREAKLERLIVCEALRQFLERKKVRVDEAEVENEFEALKKTPPAAGCSCCRYQSLEQFLTSNFYTVKEFKDTLRIENGLTEYLEERWRQKSAKQAQEMLAAEEAGIRDQYVKASHVFFNIIQDPEFFREPEEVVRRKEQQARKAWQLLEDGASFDRVAREFSEDQVTRGEGGTLGMIPKSTFGLQVEEALASLAPGGYSRPVRSPFGFHIIRREPVGREDILLVLKTDFIEKERGALVEEIMEEATIERH
jgi:hypothetical protein